MRDTESKLPADQDSDAGAEDQRLLEPIAADIAEGRAVNWNAEEDLATSSQRSLLAALKEIEMISAAHEDAQRSLTSRISQPESHHSKTEAPGMWRHLTLLDVIGEGRFGTVYRAFDKQLQIDVALKLFRPGDGGDRETALREARLLAKIRHPNVVRVFGADEDGGRVGIWMEVIQGRTLAEIVREGPLNAAEALSIGIQLADALSAVHAEQVLHGDVKAHNIIRQNDGKVVLVDFGVGRRLDVKVQTIDLAGTLVYIAPEVLDGEPRSARSDIYSLGVLLFYLLSGEYPIWADSVSDAKLAHQSKRRPLPTGRRIPRALARAIDRALSRRPQDRQPSAAALKNELARAGSRRSPVPWVVFAVLVVALLAGGIVTWRNQRTVASPQTAASTSPADQPQDAVPFDIEATFYRSSAGMSPQRLTAETAVRVEDLISLVVRTSAPAYVYVVNEDERNEQYLLFPLTGQVRQNPVPANQDVRLPEGYNWEVSSAGGREHFVVFASRTPLTQFEALFATMPAPRLGESEVSARLPPTLGEQFRAVGSLRPAPRTSPEAGKAMLSAIFNEPLVGKETARGMWVRQLTLNNRPTADRTGR